MQHLNERQESKNFTFKCHRENNVIYSVNSINFHPVRFLSPFLFFSLSLFSGCECRLFNNILLLFNPITKEREGQGKDVRDDKWRKEWFIQ